MSQSVVSSSAEKAGVTTAGIIVRRLASTPSRAEDQRSLAELPLRLAQISDIHCGHGTFDADWMRSLIERLNEMQPDVVLVVGDLTAKGYEWEYEEAVRWLETIEAPTLVIPGNHDYRNVGYIHYKHHFGEPFCRVREAFDPVRAERLVATGFTVVGVDSAEPDINEGNVGMEHYGWIREQFDEPDDVKTFAIHHHLVPIPGTGRERNKTRAITREAFYLTDAFLEANQVLPP